MERRLSLSALSGTNLTALRRYLEQRLRGTPESLQGPGRWAVAITKARIDQYALATPELLKVKHELTRWAKILIRRPSPLS